MIDRKFWSGKSVFVTGHTGFKGSWLCLWLQSLGARVVGYALEPASPLDLFELAFVSKGMESHFGDVRNLELFMSTMQAARPEIVIHLAAQALVRPSYENPVETYSTNVMGTVHVLESTRRTEGVKAVVIITSDKCYENHEWVWGYREDEAMGGYDPYSSSKGCAELVTAAYRRSFFSDSLHGAGVASARAGNVIGGGDWAKDRLVPDIMRAFLDNRPAEIRSPASVRPWQYVLDPLNGYLMLAERLYQNRGEFSTGWNFGPIESEMRPVSWIADELARRWGASARWICRPGEHPHESLSLKLDCAKARHYLGWSPRVSMSAALDWTVEWYRGYQSGADVKQIVLREIERFGQI